MNEKDLFEQLSNVGAHVEPAADQRGAARSLFGLFTALREHGFTEPQAMTLVGKLLVAVVSDDDDNDVVTY